MNYASNPRQPHFPIPPLRADLYEERLPDGTPFSRRPAVRCADIVIVARANSDAIVCHLCRALLEKGYDPRAPLEAYRGDTLALRVWSIGSAARLTVKSATRLVPYSAGDAFPVDE